MVDGEIECYDTVAACKVLGCIGGEVGAGEVCRAVPLHTVAGDKGVNSCRTAPDGEVECYDAIATSGVGEKE